MINRSIHFAVDAHGEALRKGTVMPYILHPLEAAGIVAGMTQDEEVVAAAVLHDVLEDTDTTCEQLTLAFGSRVAALVCAESENKHRELPAGDTWMQRKQESLASLRAASPQEMMIALGDKLSNLRSIHRDWQICGDGMWERFNQRDPAAQGWYYREVALATQPLCGYPAWKEYNELVLKLFGAPGEML